MLCNAVNKNCKEVRDEEKNSRPNILATLNGRLRSPVAGFPRI